MDWSPTNQPSRKVTSKSPRGIVTHEGDIANEHSKTFESQYDIAHQCISIANERILYSLVHNHPSGDPTPSKADIDMTREVVEAAGKLGIVVHDHVVIGKSGNTSFKTAGLL